MKKLFLAMVILVLAALSCWLMLATRRSAPPPAWVALPDGTRVRILAVTYGTNHVVGSQLARISARLPVKMQQILERVVDHSRLQLNQMVTATPELLVWLEHQTNGATAAFSVAYYQAYFSDAHHFISGPSRFMGSIVFGSGVDALQFNVFPRRSREIYLNFFQHDTNGTVSLCTTFPIANPQFRDYPMWQPEALPATQRTPDMEVTLLGMETGYDGNSSAQAAPHGRAKVTYGTNRVDGNNHTAVNLAIKSLSDTNAAWEVEQVEISDATGNAAKNSSMHQNSKWGGFAFMPSLWPEESAWKLKLGLKRTKAFLPEQTLVFKNVPLGARDHTNTLAWSTNWNGALITLESVTPRGPLTNESWNTSELSLIRFTHRSLPPNMSFDLVKVVFDTGATNHPVGTESTADYHQYQFQGFPAGAQTVDFTIIVQKPETVEFTVKPEMPKTMVK